MDLNIFGLEYLDLGHFSIIHACRPVESPVGRLFYLMILDRYFRGIASHSREEKTLHEWPKPSSLVQKGLSASAIAGYRSTQAAVFLPR